MKDSEDRVRFCEACNAVIGVRDAYCEECGAPTEPGRAEKPGKDEPPIPAAQRELFRAHLRLVHRFREQSRDLERHVAKLTKAAQREETRSGGVEGEQRVLALTERLLELEEEWDEIQQAYNRGSESIEEEFLGRISELEADLELPPELQSAITDEVVAFVRNLEQLQGSMQELARRLEIARVRQRRASLLGLSLPPWRAWLLVTGAAAAVSLGGTAYAAWRGGLSQPTAFIALASVVVGLAILAFHCRPR